MESTAVLRMCCSSCDKSFTSAARDGWRQRTTYLLGAPWQLFVYLCGKCASRFSSEAEIAQFMEARLEEAVARRNSSLRTG